MKLPNGFGSVHKLTGNRRKPWRARKTVGWDFDPVEKKAKQKYITIGYYTTQKDAIQALADYNANPYDISTNSITFEEVYQRWSEEHFKVIVKSAQRTWKSAFTYCEPLYKMPMRDIRVSHLEQTIKNADVGDNTKGRICSFAIHNLLLPNLFDKATYSDVLICNTSALSTLVKFTQCENATAIITPKAPLPNAMEIIIINRI